MGYQNVYPELISWIENGQLDLTPLISRCVSLEQAISGGFDALLAHKSEVKILVNPNPTLAQA